MEETHYSISEAGKQVGVESHVLRYWEDELHLEIPRNGQGHRYYTELHIRLFQKIREWKDRGYQLRAIGQVLDKWLAGDASADPGGEPERQIAAIFNEESVGEVMENEAKLRVVSRNDEVSAGVNQEKMAQFQEIMNQIIGQAVSRALDERGGEVAEEISRQVNDRMVQELEYMMRISDEREEERFRQLDETLRSYQNEKRGRAEAAAARLPFFRKKRFGRSGKKL